ncbi:MAG: CDP-glycerol glycerophosphotransferase family protein, partial [Methyloceanibacter sp.]|nr:CDP-glycerol glycerophosphotransferase family protein [Methyloceanibacter sp.]
MSRYFSAWRALLHSKRLKAISVERDLHIVFAPHLNVTQHLCDFDLPDWIQVPVGRSIQDLFSQAAVLVTDYSSVDAEVAYLEKPIVYYQFDSDETLSGAHVYKRGDFDYEQQGYGPVCQTEVHLLRELEAAVCGNRARKYVDRSRDAFRYRDGHCCKRAYQSILELDKPLPESRIVLKSYTQVPNAGDAANAAIISRLTDARVEISDGKSLSQPNLIALGSLLQWIDPRSVIWGTGVLSDEYPIATLPERVFAVRGPLTRKKLLDAGADCPELFGDPGILISDIYPRRTGSMSGLGIIPHYVDRDEPYIAEALRYGARLIDVGQPLEDYLEALCKCDCVLTSSLHGVIFAHSYGIPAAWVQLSGKVVGGSLKFRDYYASVGFNQADIPNLSGSDRVDYAVQSATLPREEIDRRQLLRALAEAQQYLFDMQQSTIIATA